MRNAERDLQERTKRFALNIIRTFSMIPKTTEAQVLGKQLRRSRTAAGANYREAYRGRSKAEFISKCGDSLRELEETAYWLELVVDGRIVPAEMLAALRGECDELLAIFVTIIKHSKDTSYFTPPVLRQMTSSLFASRLLPQRSTATLAA